MSERDTFIYELSLELEALKKALSSCENKKRYRSQKLFQEAFGVPCYRKISWDLISRSPLADIAIKLRRSEYEDLRTVKRRAVDLLLASDKIYQDLQALQADLEDEIQNKTAEIHRVRSSNEKYAVPADFLDFLLDFEAEAEYSF